MHVNWPLVIWLGAPLAVAAGLSGVVPEGLSRRSTLLFGLGVMLSLAFVVTVYLTEPRDARHDDRGCSDCEQFLGRHWEPEFVVFLAFGGLMAWLVGLAIGTSLRTLRHDRRQQRDALRRRAEAGEQPRRF
jgi:hypothetical protein